MEVYNEKADVSKQVSLSCFGGIYGWSMWKLCLIALNGISCSDWQH